MALTFGFYNSFAGDRAYDATQISFIFDGIIEDGILMNVGSRFFVQAVGGLNITVNDGRAWFDHTWTYNDSAMSLTVMPGDSLLDRIDAVVLEVDRRDESRLNSIKWVYGTPATIAARPTMIKDLYVKQYALAYISVARGSTEVLQGHITNMVGTTETPFVTAPLTKIDATDLISQWNGQWNTLHGQMEVQKGQQQTNWEMQTNTQQSNWDSLMSEMTLVYEAIETQSFNLINHNFDDWSVRRGCKFETIFNGDGSISEKITVISVNHLLAEKLTSFSGDGSVVETITFHLYTLTDGPNVIETIDISMTKTTSFNPDGSITSTVI